MTEATDSTTGSTEVEPTDDPQGGEQMDDQLGEGGKKALIAEREARKAAERAATELQAKLDAINAESMSDLERAQQAAEAAKQEAATATREALRYRFAAKYGISDEDAEMFLSGETADQVEAQAKRLADRAAVSASAGPRPDLTQGGTGSPAATSTGDKFAQLIESKLT